MTVLALCTLALFFGICRLALSSVVPDLATEFHTSNKLIGGALTGMWVTYALTQFPSRILTDLVINILFSFRWRAPVFRHCLSLLLQRSVFLS